MSPQVRRNPMRLIFSGLALLSFVIGSGCGKDSLFDPSSVLSDDRLDWQPSARNITIPPGGLTTVSLGAQNLTLWPYTGSNFDGTPVDPINLIFAGEVDPRQIRAALMALDGDRSAFGIPPVPPFDAKWDDIVGGGVQTAYTEGPLEWAGSVVQLALGDFGPIRIHLRLFRTDQSYNGTGSWTLGAAHFELQIPGTAEHQVLSWELAEQIVVADLMRTGLLDPTVPMLPTGAISETPSYRTIPAIIYNGLPDELIDLIGGPPKPVTADVPIPNDGSAMMLNVVGSTPVVPGSWHRTVAVTFDQLVPKPFCSEGPGDFLWVSGPIDLVTDVVINAQGHYTYRSSYVGHLEATPMDISSGIPVPTGEPRKVRVGGRQEGFLSGGGGRIAARDRQMLRSGEGREMWTSRLVVTERGRKTYSARESCLDSDE